MLKAEDQKWIEETLQKVEKKLTRTAQEVEFCFPYTTKNGKYEKSEEELPFDGICWWTNGFWPGMMWLMYLRTKNELFRQKAEQSEKELDKAFGVYDKLHHDVGFMWLTSAVADYRITGNDASRKRGLHAADILAARYNMVGKYIRAWGSGNINKGYAIIDCMMNIPLLYWASEQVDDPRYRYIAEQHAKTTMEHHIRPDGSSNHIVIFDQDTGEIIDNPAGQGYESGSSWSRGQAWALYGFILSYIHTHNEDFLNTAKRAAHYFIANVADEFVAKCDFRAPKEPVIYDSTAGVIAACGLIEIAKAVGEYEKDLYLDSAIRILKATEERFCDWSESEQSIVQMGTGAYHDKQHHYPIIYGDYYFIEALMKLAENDILFW
ncbi:glycoside hydrolase family 88 protein [Ructibacterium gallinarum]|uniref:Glycoside hydrolase family 88 protein n=1 Tax=Ructibacterium gallinarum TaxID=2779355 RepID=A0A9D5M6D5_9FIRM|nr:glycoside hydrolase family 88 protein [Ructibacterium gallinarum]MBE5040337.1 glycoside hydrolase family 88 protein [Ructibacterium gallinarum]